ncbi:AAA domain-containing protein [Rathayibacter rathayi NCPPB 2980 = VKM Ac-1601]|nr:AAA family ATPase [Rathayibacter rathayi]MWV75352.1 AAA family ATPase [Rathayibacter rathayi NCPPB 2980 = VKM Ac-1601]TWD69127.1 AAA domain-containing protein [Rathayibacter rathayi]SOE05415.1 AAA domain-containing protein [Rathayibacter rathayi NCPPB 2980 = VKM Ac-1601]
MPRCFLTKLSVEGFRGINNEDSPLVLSFKRDEVNSIFATNGSGKSSLYEALQYAFFGKVPRLEEMQSAEKPENYVANMFHSTGTSRIEVTLSPDDSSADSVITITRSAAGVRQVSSPTGHPDPQDLLSSLGQDFALLDYVNFTKFIDDTALERGRSFSSLLGLSDYANYRRALKAVEQTQSFKTDFDIPDLEARQKQLLGSKDRARAGYSSRFTEVTGTAHDDGISIEASSAQIVSSLASVPLLSAELADKTLRDTDFGALHAIVREAEGNESQGTLVKLIEVRRGLTDTLIQGEQAASNIEDISKLANEHQQALAATAGAAAHSLLQAAEAFLTEKPSWPDDKCPLCESELTHSLSEHIAEELNTYATESRVRDALRDAVLTGPLLACLKSFEKQFPVFAPDEAALSPRLRESASSGSLSTEEIDKYQLQLDALTTKATEKVAELSVAIEAIERDLPPSLVTLTTQIASAEGAQLELIQHEAAEKAEITTTQELQTFARWKSFLGQANAVFADAESALSQRILADLKSDYQALFQDIMVVGGVVPSLARSGSGENLKVELSDFHGHHDVSARALLSESYRNALAISVFLSAAVKHGKAPRFVVLDDVTSSFDSGHQYRLMEHIRRHLQYPMNPNGLQFIMLSHDVSLEKYFDKLGNDPGWNHQKLQGWPPATPISIHGQDADRLKTDATRLLNAGQVPEGAGLIRQYFEFVLLQIIRKLKIPVPIDLAVSDHNKMVSSCLDAIVAAVRLNDRAGQVALDANQIADLTKRYAPALISNRISHYGTAGAAMFSPPVLLGVLADIDALRDCFKHQDATTGNWIFYKSITQR